MSGPADRAGLIRAFEGGRAADDVDAMASAAVALAALHQFGTPPGSTPGYLYEAYSLTSGARRVRLAATLARIWVYGSEPLRAVPFAAEAVAEASRLADPALLADALDARLLVHWGPDDLAERSAVTALLEDTVAHLTDVEARLSSHLWRLTTAIESLDLIGAQRPLRALDELADESGSARVRLFAASRRGMYALLVGDLAMAREAREATRRAGENAVEPDTEALVHELSAGLARQAADQDQLAAEAAAFEGFGTAQGVRSVLAEAAVLWLAAGHRDRAGRLLDRIGRPDLSSIPRDVDWLLTVSLLTEVAAGTGAKDIAAQAVELLAPYAGRGVTNAGAVAFLGVVDDYLRLACTALGRLPEADAWARTAADCYARIGARWWLDRLRADLPAGTRPAGAAVVTARLSPGPDGVWTVGRAGRDVAVREMKGFRHLRLLLERPGVELTALELMAAAGGHPHTSAPVPAGSLGEVLDRQALSAYRRRISELDQELAEARSWADVSRAAALAAERGMLLDEVAAATGLGGRQRVTGSAAERARVAVRKSLAAAITRITRADPELGRLLRDTVRTGSACCYDPDPARPVTWLLHP